VLRRFNEAEPGPGQDTSNAMQSKEFHKILQVLAGSGFIRILQQNSSNPEIRRLQGED